MPPGTSGGPAVTAAGGRPSSKYVARGVLREGLSAPAAPDCASSRGGEAASNSELLGLHVCNKGGGGRCTERADEEIQRLGVNGWDAWLLL